LSATAGTIAGRTTIAGVPIHVADFRTVLRTIVDRAECGDGAANGYVVTPNAHHVVMYQKDALLRQIYDRAFLVVPDGVPLLWAAKFLGGSLAGRVNGTDLVQSLCAEAEARGLRVFFLGGRPGAALAAAERLRARHPALDVCGTYCPAFGFKNDPIECANIVERVNSARPHLLFVGLGAPKQEYWMYRHRDALRVPMSIGIGVSFELIGGVIRRAPLWMQFAGLEWFFRLLAEPKRLWKRYVFGNSAFCMLVARQYLNWRANR